MACKTRKCLRTQLDGENFNRQLLSATVPANASTMYLKKIPMHRGCKAFSNSFACLTVSLITGGSPRFQIIENHINCLLCPSYVWYRMCLPDNGTTCAVSVASVNGGWRRRHIVMWSWRGPVRSYCTGHTQCSQEFSRVVPCKLRQITAACFKSKRSEEATLVLPCNVIQAPCIRIFRNMPEKQGLVEI
jgi:hypothetical protein